jgi:formylmethanofuran dehydrogenase subunit B
VTPLASPRPSDAADIARKLVAARRVLVTGLQGVSADVIVAACNLAETIGAAIDTGDAETARPAGPTIARAGEVTADREELRDRADLVIFWFCDPQASDPTFSERFVSPSPALHVTRRTLAVGPTALACADRHVRLPREAAVDAARLVQYRLLHSWPAGEGEPLAGPCATIADAIDHAACVAIVTDHAADPLGLEPWSVVHLVRTIAHRKPAFEIPLTGGEAKLCASILTWRYGAAGAIAMADRSGGRFLPGEASAARLIERGEADCVVVVGGLTAHVAEALETHKGTVAVITLDDSDPAVMKAHLGAIANAARSVTALRRPASE